MGRRLALSTGVLIGIGLDLSTTNYHLRWSLAGQARRWNRRRLRLGLSDDELEHWIDELKDRGWSRALGQPDDRLARAAWSPAGLPASFGSAGPASRSRATRRPACRPWRSRRSGSSAASSMRRSSARSISRATSACGSGQAGARQPDRAWTAMPGRPV